MGNLGGLQLKKKQKKKHAQYNKLCSKVEHTNEVFKTRVKQLKGQYTDEALDLIARY